MNNAFASLMLFEKQKLHCVARRHSLSTIYCNSVKTVFQRGIKRTFNVTLVDTR